jgi:hypothetical protein
MNKAAGSAALIAALAVSAVLPYLIQLGYHAMDPEVLVICAAAAAAGFGLGWLTRNWTRLYSALAAFLVYWIIDAYFANTLWTIPMAAVAGLIAYILLHGRFGANIRAMLAAFSLFWIASNVLTPPLPLLMDDSIAAETLVVANPSAPPVVHFIFDELMSPTAVADGFPHGDHPAAHLIDDLASRGFEVHTDVRSNAELTRVSVTSLFGLMNSRENWQDGPSPFTISVKDNAYLRDLRDKGYAVTVYQSNYIQLCSRTPGETCYTYSRNGNGHAYSAITDDIPARVTFALVELDNHLSNASVSGTVGVYILAKQLAIWLGWPLQPSDYYSTPAAMLSVLDDLEAKLRNIKHGEAVIVHVLLPHAPYILDQTCKPRPQALWSRGRRPERPVASTTTQIYADYWDQVGCMSRHLQRLLDTTLASEAGRDAIIMLHGDHGARVTFALDKPSDLLQTMFAIRDGRKAQGRAEPAAASLQDLFAQTVRSRIP